MSFHARKFADCADIGCFESMVSLLIDLLNAPKSQKYLPAKISIYTVTILHEKYWILVEVREKK